MYLMTYSKRGLGGWSSQRVQGQVHTLLYHAAYWEPGCKVTVSQETYGVTLGLSNGSRTGLTFLQYSGNKLRFFILSSSLHKSYLLSSQILRSILVCATEHPRKVVCVAPLNKSPISVYPPLRRANTYLALAVWA